MAHEPLILLDTSVLIDYFRKTQKERTFFVALSEKYPRLGVSVLTKFEIYLGSTPPQIKFWDSIFAYFEILPFTESCADVAVEIQQDLKKKGLEIDLADLLIGATAKCHSLPLATLNIKHFQRITDLEILH